MKVIHTLPLLFILVLACNPQSGEENTGIESLRQQKEDLEAEYKILAEKIRDLDVQIQEESGEKTTRISKVSTVKANYQPFSHYFQVQGQVEADKNIVLTAETSGVVRAIYVSEGQNVQAGQKLVALDTEILDKNIEEAMAAYDLASFIYERQKRLWDQNIGSELEFKQAKNEKLRIEASLASLNAQKEKSVIRAPFSGVIDNLIPKEGELVNPGSPVGRLVNLDRLKLEADVSERYVGKIDRGTKANLYFPAIDLSVETELTQVGKYIDPANRTIDVRAKLSRSSKALLPNLVAEVNIQDYSNDNAIVIPTKAIQQDLENKNYVYILVNKGDIKSVERVYVTPGFTYQGQTEIIKGLSGTEEVVVKGARSITSGSVVTVES